jgi:RNA polymerase sigma-70 factor, ECF subfamily
MVFEDAAVVAQVRAGDREAFRLLVEKYSRELFKVAYRFLADEAEAEDAVQEALVKAYRSLHNFESRSKFSTWLYRIVANCCYDMLEKRKRTPQPAAFDGEEDEEPVEMRVRSDEPDPERQLLSLELKAKVATAMNDLSASEKVAFIMKHSEGKSMEEIGEALGINRQSAKNTVFRAVQKMRKNLAPLRVSR